MKVRKFGPFYINLEQFIYAQKFTPKVLPAAAVRARNLGGISIGLKSYELIIYEDEPGYAEFVEWLDAQSG